MAKKETKNVDPLPLREVTSSLKEAADLCTDCTKAVDDVLCGDGERPDLIVQIVNRLVARVGGVCRALASVRVPPAVEKPYDAFLTSLDELYRSYGELPRTLEGQAFVRIFETARRIEGAADKVQQTCRALTTALDAESRG